MKTQLKMLNALQYRTAPSVTGPWVGGNKEGLWSARAQVPTNPSLTITFDTQNSFLKLVQQQQPIYMGDWLINSSTGKWEALSSKP